MSKVDDILKKYKKDDAVKPNENYYSGSGNKTTSGKSYTNDEKKYEGSTPAERIVNKYSSAEAVKPNPNNFKAVVPQQNYDVRNSRQQLRNAYQIIVDEANKNREGKKPVDYSGTYDAFFGGSPATQSDYERKAGFLDYARGEYARNNEAQKLDLWKTLVNGAGGNISPAKKNTKEYQAILDQIEQNNSDKERLPAKIKAQEENEAKRKRYESMSLNDVEHELSVKGKSNQRDFNRYMSENAQTDANGTRNLFADLYNVATANFRGANTNVGDDILYYDTDGTIVTYNSLIAEKKHQEDITAIGKNPQLRDAYAQFTQSFSEMEGINADNEEGRDRGFINDTSGRIAEAMGGKDFTAPSMEGDEQRYQRAMRSSSRADEARRVLAAAGYDADALWQYEQKLRDREKYEIASQTANEIGSELPFIGQGISMLTSVGQAPEYIGTVIGSLGYKNNPYVDSNAYRMNYTTATTGLSGAAGEKAYDDVYRWTGSKTVATIGKGAFSGIASGFESRAVMEGAMALFGPMGEVAGRVGEFILGSQAAASTYQQAVINGSTNNQAILYSLASGINEAIFEHLSFGELKGIKDIIERGMNVNQLGWSIAKAVGLQMGTEALEEDSTDFFNSIADNIINGDKSEYRRAKADYLMNGYSEADAEKMASMDFVQQLIESGLGGAFGGLSGGATHVVGAVYNQSRGAVRNVANAVASESRARVEGTAVTGAGNVSQLLNTAEGSTDSKVQRAAEKVRNFYNAETGEYQQSKKAERAAGRLYEAIQNETANKASSLTFVEGVVSEVLPDADENTVSAIAKYTTGREDSLTDKEMKALEQVSDAQYESVAERLSSEETQEAYNEVLKKTQGEFNRNALSLVSEEDLQEKADERNGVDRESIEDSVVEEIEDGKGIKNVAELNKDGSIKSYMLEDGTKVDASQVKFADSEQGYDYASAESVAKKHNLNAETVNFLVNARSLTNISDSWYWLAVNEIAGYAMNGVTEKNLPMSGFTGVVGENLRHSLYTTFAQQYQAQRSSFIEKNNAKAQVQRANAEGRAFSQGRISSELYETLTDRQKAGVDAVKQFIEYAGINLDVQYYASVTDSKGRRVLTRNVGSLKAGDAAPNGMYSEGGTVYLDLNAGNMGEGVIAYTFAHELTHHIAANNAEAFVELAEYLANTYAKKDGTVDAWVEAQQWKAHSEGRSLTYEEAREEAVADAMKTMLTDGNATEKIAELKAEHKGVWQAIKDAIAEIRSRLDEWYKNVAPYAQEAQIIRQWKNEYDTIADMWVKAVAEIGGVSEDAEQRIDAEALEDTGEKVKYSPRAVDSEGRELSEGQTEFFKDSKVRDEKGRLLTMYHGTPNGTFTKFRSSYFTENKDYASLYVAPGASYLGYKQTSANPKVYEVYLNITKPFDTRNAAEREIFNNEFYRKWGTGAPLQESGLPDWMDGEDLQEFIEDSGYDYDGIILDEGGTGGYGDEVKSRGISYKTFSANQVKSVDNVNPTDNEDYRYDARTNAEYMELAKNPEKNRERLQELVDEAAKAAGFVTMLFRGSERSGHTQFRNPSWFTSDRNVAKTYAKSGTDNVYSVYADTNDFYEYDGKGDPNRKLDIPDDLRPYLEYEYRNEKMTSTDALAYAAESAGYKGIVFKNIKDTGMNNWEWADGVAQLPGASDVYAFFDVNSQVKSAEPVTYDDNGNVIPLSERFNEAEPDIRFEIRKSLEGYKYVDVDENLIDVNDGQSIASNIARVLRNKFGNLLLVNKQEIRVNSITNREFRLSNYGKALYSQDKQKYNDKIKSLGNADELIKVANKWCNENIKHTRNDNIVSFARAEILYKVGARGYKGDLLVGIKDDGSALLYEIVNISDIKITDASPAVGTQKIPSSGNASVKDNNSTYSSNSQEGNSKISSGEKGNEATERRDARQLAPTFYSQLERTIENMKMDKIGASSVINFLKGKGVKDEEIKWSGLIPFLEGKKSVTKAELQQVLSESQVQIETVVKDDSVSTEGRFGYPAYDNDWTDDEYRKYDKLKSISEKKAKAFEDAWRKEYGDDYPEMSSSPNLLMNARLYQPDIENANSELLDTLKAAEEANLERVNYRRITSTRYMEERESEARTKATNWKNHSLEGGSNYREFVFSLPGSNYSNFAMRHHWGGMKGVIAHARIQDMNSDNGKMLFIEEIQSDWHNTGNKTGFAPEGGHKYDAELSEVRGEPVYKLVVDGKVTDFYENMLEFDSREEAVSRLSDWYEQELDEAGEGTIPNAPYAGSSGSYVQFVLKNLLREAAEKNYDRIGWTTAQMQSDRWMDEYAEMYRIEYDQEIPKFLKKYGKQWGATVGKTTLDNGAEVWTMNITDAMKESVLYEGQPKFSARGSLDWIDEGEGRVVNGRIELAEALMKIAKEEEIPYIQFYIDKMGIIQGYQDKLQEFRDKISMHYSGEAKMNKADLSNAKTQAQKLAEKISKEDARLLELYSMKPIKDVIARSAKSRNARYVERRESTDYRNKIKGIARGFERRLLKPTANTEIPVKLANTLIDVCNMIDYTSDNQETNLAKGRRSAMEALGNLRNAYDSLEDSPDSDYAGEYDSQMSKNIRLLQDSIGDKPMRDLTLKQLKDVYEVLRDIQQTVINAHKLIGKSGTTKAHGTALIHEMGEQANNPAHGKWKDFSRNWFTNPMRAAFEMGGFNENSELYTLFKDLNEGRKKADFWKMNARRNIEKLVSDNRKAYNDAVEKTAEYTLPYVQMLSSGDVRKGEVEIKATKMQLMQLVLTWEREQANMNRQHLAVGAEFPDGDLLRKGKFDEAFANKTSTRTVSIETINEVLKILNEGDDAEFINKYMDEARRIFREVSADAINEVTVQVKHRPIATEKNYIPYELDKNYIARELEQVKMDVSLMSEGMLKSVVPNAKQPAIMRGLHNVLDTHIEKTGKLYGFAAPVKNFNKIYNYKDIGIDAVSSRSVREAIEEAWGKKTQKMIEDAVAEVQGNTKGESNKLLATIKSGFVTSTLAGNLSVWMKQAASYPTAGSILSTAALIEGLPKYTAMKRRQVWDEIDKYTAEHYNRRMGLSEQELGEFNQSHGWQKRLSDKMGVFSPMNWIQAMDVYTTGALWEACKAEFRIQNKHAVTTNEDFREVAKLYEKVLEETQPMYDSLHRAGVAKDNHWKNIIMFQTQPIQNSGILREATLELKHANKHGNDERKRDARKKFAKAVSSQLVSAATFAAMTFAAAALTHRVNPYRDDDKEVTLESVAPEVLRKFITTFLSACVPVLGNYAVSFEEAVEQKLKGKQSYGVVSDPTVDQLEEFAENGIKIFIDIGNAIKEGDISELKLKDFENALFNVGLVFGVPLNNLKNNIKGIRLHIEDAINGEFGSFEADVERTQQQEANIAYRAYSEGDEEKFAEHAENVSEEKFRDLIKAAWENGDIDSDEARRQLEEIGGKASEDAYWAVDKWEGMAEDGEYGKYDNFFNAVETGKNLKAVIKEYTDNGVSTKTLATNITKHFKPLYVEMNGRQRSDIKGYLLNAYVQLGYDRDEKSKDIDKWVK